MDRTIPQLPNHKPHEYDISSIQDGQRRLEEGWKLLTHQSMVLNAKIATSIVLFDTTYITLSAKGSDMKLYYRISYAAQGRNN